MSNLIQLESRLCPNCDRTLDRWTLKVVVKELQLGVRCPACGDFIGLTMKGGDYDRGSTGETETQHPEELTTNIEKGE